MKFRLVDVQFTDVECRVKTFDKEVTAKLETTLGLAVVLEESKANQFAIIFEIGLASKPKTFKFKLKATAHFEASEKISSDFVNSPFARINAPAIAFPYIRSFISNFTLNCGYNPVMLPSFNFVEMAKGEVITAKG
jgi:preprotein translocase subunit SecB